ncbi:histidine kinase dimerization/phospho-acceptor domain-containing protein [Robinsoniella peoriensis]
MVEALAHDLKSPLSVIKAYAEALTDDTKVNEEQQ